MTKTKSLLAVVTFGMFLSLGCLSVKADTATATNMIPTLRAMYRVNEAEVILNNKVAALKACRRNKASDYEIALAQAAVTDAKNLLNTLNGLISRDITMIKLAPAGVVNPPTFATNSLSAQGAWNDFIYKEKCNHVMVFPSSRVPTAAELALAAKPFSMY